MKFRHTSRKDMRTRIIVLIILTSGILAGVLRILTLTPEKVLADSLFPLDEGYGTSVNDANRNVSAGTITGATWRSDEFCRSQKCLHFDGSGDYVAFADDPDLDFAGSDAFTISGWFRHPQISAVDYIAVKYGTGVAGGYVVAMDADGDIMFGIDDDGTFSNSDNIGDDQSKNYDDNRWHHFAAVKDGTAGTYLYVDGQLIDQDTSLIENGSLVNAASLYIGITADATTGSWDGYLDELKIYRTARTAAEVKADYLGGTTGRGTSASFGSAQDFLSNGLVGYWNMDENTGTSIADLSGNSNTSSAFTGNVAWVKGKYGSGLDFDGVDDVVRVVETPSTDLGATTDSYTMSIWVNTDNLSANAEIFSKRTASTYPSRFIITSTETITFEIRGSGSNKAVINSVATLTPGVWYHLAVVRNVTTDTVSLYVNGVLDTSTPDISEGSLANDDDWSFGNAGTSYTGADFSGSLDEARLYNRALPAADIAKLYAWGPSPMAYWKMDEASWTNNCSTSTVFDSSGNGNNGMSCPNSTGPTSPARGKVGTAGIFDGSDDYVEVSQSWKNNLSNFTTSMWVYVNTLNGTASEQYHLYQRLSGDTSYPRLRIMGDGKISVQVSVSAVVDTVTTASPYIITSGVWNHIAVEYDNGANLVYIYLNGVLVKSGTVGAGTLDVGTANLRMGKNGVTAGYLNGKMDEFRVYNYLRTPSQIIEDMNAGRPAPGSTVGSTAGSWSFDEGALNTCSGGVNDFCDASPNANNLAFSTTTGGYASDGKYNRAFNGTGSVWITQSADDSDFDFDASEDMSVSLWFRSDSATNPASETQYLLGKGTITNTGTAGYAMYANTSGNIVFGIRDDTTWGAASPTTPTSKDSVTSTSDIYDATWHHITAVKTGTSRMDLYVDGKLQASDTSIASTGSLANSIVLRLADDDSDATNSFAGDLDEVKIYRAALTAEQVSSEYGQGSQSALGALSTDASGNADNSYRRGFCPPGNTEGNCGGSNNPAPIAHWNFDENAGTSVLDVSGNGYSGSLGGDTKWVTGKIGSGLSFDGTGDSVDVTQATAFDFGTSTAFTFSVWVKSSGNGANHQGLITAQNIANAYFDFTLRSTGKIRASIFDNTGTLSCAMETNSTFNDGNWHHVSAVFNRNANNPCLTTDILVYVDGRLQATTAAATSTSTNVNIDIGRIRFGSTGSSAINGIADDFRIYDYARTPAQIAWDYNRGAPVGWWQMDENVSGDARVSYDASGNGNNGTTHYGANSTGMDCTVAGKFNTACNFDGTDDYISFSNTSSLPTGDFSYSMWVYHDVAATDTIFTITDSAGTGDEAQIKMTSTGTFRFVLDAASKYTTTETYPLSTWHHVVMTRNGSNMTMYVNGNQVGTATDADTLAFGSCSLIIGFDSDGAAAACDDTPLEFWGGKIDDFRIYNYALTAQQVKSVMNEGSAVRFAP